MCLPCPMRREAMAAAAAPVVVAILEPPWHSPAAEYYAMPRSVAPIIMKINRQGPPRLPSGPSLLA